MSLFSMFSNDLGVDLGTSNVLIYADGKGLVVREPSVVAVDKNTGKILQVGAAARNMLGRTPGNVVAMKPLRDGIISDHEMTVRLLQELFKTATKASIFTPKPRVVISVPSGVTEIEERNVINAAIEAGARGAILKDAPNASLRAAIRTIAAGGESFADDIVRNITRDPTPRELTARQAEILKSVTNGLTNKTIAQQLKLTPESLKQHLNAIFQKLGATTRAEAVAIALRKHLLKI